MWRSEALGGTIRELPESLTEAKGTAGSGERIRQAEGAWVRQGPFVPSASLEAGPALNGGLLGLAHGYHRPLGV